MNKAHVTHPELKATFNLDILGVKKNPNGAMYSSLGVITKGTILEVNVSELGLVTPGGKVVWGKYAQVGGRYHGSQISSRLPQRMVLEMLCDESRAINML